MITILGLLALAIALFLHPRWRETGLFFYGFAVACMATVLLTTTVPHD